MDFKKEIRRKIRERPKLHEVLKVLKLKTWYVNYIYCGYIATIQNSCFPKKINKTIAKNNAMKELFDSSKSDSEMFFDSIKPYDKQRGLWDLTFYVCKLIENYET